MAGPNPWQAKAARDTGESASAHGSGRPATPGPAGSGHGGIFGVGSAEGVAVSGEFVGAGAVEPSPARAGAQKPAGVGAVASAAAGSGEKPGEGAQTQSVSTEVSHDSADSAAAATKTARDSKRRRAEAVRARAAAVRGVGTPLRGHWGYLVAAVGAFITLVLMTRPW